MRILQISGLPGPPGLRHSSTHPVVSDGELPLPASTADGMPRIPASPSALLTTVREYRQKYPACVLLVRVGDFYELYYEQADEVGGDVLGLQVVDKKFKSGSVRFTGFPVHTLLRHVETMVVKHRLSVALCEQFQEPDRRSFTRRVTRVITPGTLIDDECLATTRVHNYILCIARRSPRVDAHEDAMDAWRRETRNIEHAHRERVERIRADALRQWRDQMQGTMKRRLPGRPRKDAVRAIEPVAFDISRVEVPDPPPMPPQPEMPSGEAAEPADDGDEELSLAWLDLATGDFMACSSIASMLSADLARIQPQEILVAQGDSRVQKLLSGLYPQSPSATRPLVTEIAAALFHQNRVREPSGDISTEAPEPNSPEAQDVSLKPNAYWQISAPSQQLVASPEHLLLEASELSQGEQTAARGLLSYVMDTQLGLLPPLQPPRRYEVDGHMRMGAATIQALELLRPIVGDRADSGPALLREIDHTRTSAGARLLAKRLTAPSTSRDIIEQRLDLVEFFCATPRVRARVYEQLENIGDVERAVNKLSLNCGGPHDLLAIAKTLREVARIKRTLREYLRSVDDANGAAENGMAPAQQNQQQQQQQQPIQQQQQRRRQTVTTASHKQSAAVVDIVRRKVHALQALPALARDITAKIRIDADRDVRAFGFLTRDCSPT
ncbi:MutS protein 1, partial [Coemansia sp. RSA 2618]